MLVVQLLYMYILKKGLNVDEWTNQGRLHSGLQEQASWPFFLHCFKLYWQITANTFVYTVFFKFFCLTIVHCIKIS